VSRLGYELVSRMVDLLDSMSVIPWDSMLDFSLDSLLVKVMG